MVKNGFTLIELMVVVAIVAILAAIAYPSYSNYKIRTNRVDAQSELMFIAQKMNEYKGMNGSFQGATVSGIYGASTIPKMNGLYDVTFDPTPTQASRWILIAKPKNGTIQKDNGWLCLNYKGERLWVKGQNSCSNLSSSTNWDGR